MKIWRKKYRLKKSFLSFEKLFIPINVDNIHWILVVVKLEEKEISYLDSLRNKSNGGKYIKHVLMFLEDEFNSMNEDKDVQFEPSQWKLQNVVDNPHQKDSNSCGVYVCVYADLIPYNFFGYYTWDTVVQFRMQIAKSIILQRHRCPPSSCQRTSLNDCKFILHYILYCLLKFYCY